MHEQTNALPRAFGLTGLSDKDVRFRIVRSCMGITAAVCVIYGAYSVPQAALAETKKAAEETPRLVILGREEEETIALIAESIQQEDGTVLSLDAFLDTLICGACSRKCPLLAPRCRRGMSKAETQSAYYAEALELLSQDVPDGLRYEDLSFERT